MATPASSWPTLTGETGSNKPDDSDVRWETVKTEEEEYLDKLQSKLSHVMAEGYNRCHGEERSISNTYDAPQPQERPTDVTVVAMPADSDEGLHLLYEYDLPKSPQISMPSSSNNQPGPEPSPAVSMTSEALPIQFPRVGDGEPIPTYDVEDSPTGRRRTIRFRSRVRITSGIRGISASSSSSCGSASSSISAPLRGNESYDSLRFAASAKNPTAPLSEMLPTVVANDWLTEVMTAVRKKRRHSREPSESSSYITDERTPLKVSRRRSYTEPTDDADSNDDDLFDRLRRARRKTEEQVMFGKWPWRLLNWHWWWWKFEPVFCCCEMVDDDSDLE